jgi:hypothetical protein
MLQGVIHRQLIGPGCRTQAEHQQHKRVKSDQNPSQVSQVRFSQKDFSLSTIFQHIPVIAPYCNPFHPQLPTPVSYVYDLQSSNEKNISLRARRFGTGWLFSAASKKSASSIASNAQSAVEINRK